MKVVKSEIPLESITNQYLPADYEDTFVCKISKDSQLTPDDVMVRFWTDFPAWVDFLFRIRNFLVKFMGLEGSMQSLQELEDCIRTGRQCSIASVPAKNENETLLLLDDKHLSARMSVYVERLPVCQQVYAITLVHFKNKLGRIYFFFVRPFHKIIVKSILKRTVK